MRALVLDAPGRELREADLGRPELGLGQVRIRVGACGVCRPDLHVRDGELPGPKLPLILGHQIVGTVLEGGDGPLSPGLRVGVPWLGWTCDECRYCRAGRENLCDRALFTGYTLDGGFAEETVADARYCFPLPEGPADEELAPLLCAGLIGYRALRAAGEGERLGLYGFGAAAHIIAQVAVQETREVYAFTSPGDAASQQFAMSLGAVWAGSSTEPPPRPLDAAIIFAPVGALVPEALSRVGPGGVVVCAGIHMSDIPSFPYALLWEERVVRSVANLTRQDATEFLALAARMRIKTHVVEYPLAEANKALDDVRGGRVQGAAVLIP